MKRRRYDYVQGQEVLKKIHDPTKLGERTEGPYTITRVHVNGTVTLCSLMDLLRESTLDELSHINQGQQLHDPST